MSEIDTECLAYEKDGKLIVPWRVDDKTVINLLTVDDFNSLADGTKVISIFGKIKEKGVDEIDLDTRFGRIAFGLLAEKRRIEAKHEERNKND